MLKTNVATSNNENNKIDWLTTAQIVSMLLVVLHHSLPNYCESGVIYTVIASNVHLFALASFFGISGYLANRSTNNFNAGQYIYKRLIKLIIPFIVINLLMLIPKLFIQYKLTGSFNFTLIGLLLAFIDPHGSGICPHLWYLPSLFIMSLTVPVFKQVKNNKLKIVILAIAFAVTFLPNTTTWFCINELRMYLFYYVLGFFCGKIDFNKLKSKYKIFILSINLICCGILIIFKDTFSFSHTLITLSGFIVIILGAQLTSRAFIVVNRYLGPYIFTIYLLSLCIQNFVEVVCRLMNMDWMIAAMLMFVTAIIIPILIAKILLLINKKVKIKYLLIAFGLR